MRYQGRNCRGFALIEALVAYLIFSLGLLGLGGLLAMSQRSEMEAFQRAYALTLLDDMANRIRNNVTANRGTMACYDLDFHLGEGTTFSNTGCDGIADADLAAWDADLKGSGEKEDGANVGAMLGARGCVSRNAADPRIIHVAVAWQGLSETAAPNTSDCGASLYGSEAQRRIASRDLLFANAID